MQEQAAEQLETPRDTGEAEVTVGVELAQTRKQMGKTVEEIAEDLNLSVVTIRAIENDHLDENIK